MLKAFQLIFRRKSSWRTRMMAFVSIVCMTYFMLMTLAMSSLAWYGILPNIFKNDLIRIHRHKLFIGYVFLNAIGNCVLCLTTNTSVKKHLKPENIKRLRKTDKECRFCKCLAPPRSHHCRLCETCILKRDHHCFFMTVCIGYHNQKYFIMYCFYMLIGTFYGMFLIVKYLKVFYGVTFYGPQTFIYIFIDVVVKVFARPYHVDELYAFMVFMMFGSLSAGLFAAGLWFWQMLITFAGQSTFEASQKIWKYSSYRYSNFKDVFGKYWLITMLLPLPLPQCSDGIYSDNHRSLKTNKKM